MKKGDFVNNIFTSVHKKYDIMNDIMSFSLHRVWKNKLMSFIDGSCIGEKVIDMACGTCDISHRIAKRFPGTHILACDINESMISFGRDRLADNNITNVSFVCSDAENLPFPDSSIGCYVIVFGIRNVQERIKALKEAFRVLKEGGQLVCMEFSPIKNESHALFSKAYEFYSDKIIPIMGTITAGNRNAYEYLVNSIKNFPDGESFRREISSTKFQKINEFPLMNGIVKIHTAYKVSESFN